MGADGPDITFAPDGQKIAFVSDRNLRIQIYSIDLQSGEVQQLTDRDSSATQPDWSPDGRQIVYRDANIDIYTMNADGMNQKPLLQAPAKPGRWLRFSPVWAPDRQRIAFCEMVWKAERLPEVRLIIYDTVSKRQQIRDFRRGLQAASWMEDDVILLSMIDDKSDKYDIYRYHIGDDTVINLTNTPNMSEYHPDWISDTALDISPKEKNKILGTDKT